METTEFINGIIDEEFADISLYQAEAAHFADKIIGGKGIAGTFLAFAREELGHAHALMNLVGKVGDTPARNIVPGNSLERCLETHRAREAVSVIFYKRLLKLIPDPGHKLMLKGILAQEMEHLHAVTEYLKRIRKHGKN